MKGQKGAGPLEVIVHLDPKLFVIGMDIAWHDAIANLAGKTRLCEAFAHYINQAAARR